ncbi:hypothetical protein GCM10027028_57950 [Streptomyces sundarbansensis]
MRRKDAREKGRRSCWAFIALCSDCHAVTSMSMECSGIGGPRIVRRPADPRRPCGPGVVENART